MAINFEIEAQVRHDAGKGASRRLRREGKLPAIIYGGGKPPQNLMIAHGPVMYSLEHEAFYSHILNVRIDGKTERAVLKDLQRHPYKRVLLHMDLQRVSEDEKLRMRVPLHFLGEEKAPGVKQGGGIVSHLVTEVDVSCLPRHLPEYLEVDVSNMNVNDTLHLSDIPLPEGVELIELSHGPEHDQPVVSIHIPRAAIEAAPTEEAEAPEAKAEGGEAGEEKGD
jgi:large subunit ribosomal protein L25